jgi:hypothetical protein
VDRGRDPGRAQALERIKASTPLDAKIQVDPLQSDWPYMPAFGERRMTAGMPSR